MLKILAVDDADREEVLRWLEEAEREQALRALQGPPPRIDDLDEADNWSDAFYELALELGPRDDARLGAAMSAPTHALGIETWFTQTSWRPARHEPVDNPMEVIRERANHVHDVVQVPIVGAIVCGLLAIREDHDDRTDWLILYLPGGALVRTHRLIAELFMGLESYGPHLA
jgi:hypothetical protein